MAQKLEGNVDDLIPVLMSSNAAQAREDVALIYAFIRKELSLYLGVSEVLCQEGNVLIGEIELVGYCASSIEKAANFFKKIAEAITIGKPVYLDQYIKFLFESVEGLSSIQPDEKVSSGLTFHILDINEKLNFLDGMFSRVPSSQPGTAFDIKALGELYIKPLSEFLNQIRAYHSRLEAKRIYGEREFCSI